LALHLRNALNATAVWANRAFRPNAGLNPRIGGFLVLKMFA
jgi:hypothetical protein